MADVLRLVDALPVGRSTVEIISGDDFGDVAFCLNGIRREF